MNELRYSLRSLARSPGFTIAAVATLALGIGANTAIFSVVDAVLLRPLPYPDSDRIVTVWDQLLKYNLPRRSPEYHTADAYRKLDNIFESTAGVFWYDEALTGDGGAEKVQAMTVSPQVFPMLEPQTSIGRIFTLDEYRPNAEPVMMISHALFLRRYGGDASILGKSIRIGQTSRRVVGVLSPSFRFSLSGPTDFWIPIPLNTRQSWGNATRMIARLRPGVTLEMAQAALSAAAKHVDETEHPYMGPHGEDAGYGVKVITLHEFLLGQFRPVTLILLSAVAAVLLIACVNVANLLLARAVSREKEIVVRRALGATTGRLMAQWITESAVLALVGGTLGSVAAVWGVKLLERMSPAALPGVATISVDGRALAFALAISCLVCLLFGLAPALASVKMSWGTRGTTRRSRSAASLLITAEVAFAVMLMVGAGLLLKSFSRLIHVDPGFNPSHLLVMRAEFTRGTFPPERLAFFTRLRESLAALPGVTSATVGDYPVGGGGINAGAGDPFGIKGRSYDRSTDVTQFANLTTAGIDYFRTLEIPLLAGRAFTAADSAGPFPSAVIVNETLAKAFFPEGAVGQQIGVPPPCRDTKCDFVWTTIAGVVGDVKTRRLDMAARPQIYLPVAGRGIILRTAGDPMLLAPTVAKVIHAADPNMLVLDAKTMEDQIWSTVAEPRFEAAIVGFFAAAAVFLAAIGIFGVVAHTTVQRTQEIGIRMALGADGTRVIEAVMLDGLRPVLGGVLLGLAGAFASSRLISSILFNVKATDLPTFLMAAGILAIVAIGACLGPARRATRVDPMVALRAE
jgi:putative ABC transport system permease protein